MEIRVNKERVSHIEIHDFRETKYIWREEKPIKFLWIFTDGKYEEGYWRNGQQSHYNWMMDKEDVTDYIDKNGVLVEKPRIQIYTGKCLIKQKYFNTLKDAQNYCQGKFPNVNVKFI